MADGLSSQLGAVKLRYAVLLTAMQVLTSTVMLNSNQIIKDRQET
jgi:hypothetical protein